MKNGSPNRTALDSILSNHLGDDLTVLWESIRAGLRKEYGDATFRSWLRPIHLDDQQNFLKEGETRSTVHMIVPTRFMRDWIQAKYLDRLTELWQEKLETVATVSLAVRTVDSQATNKLSTSAFQRQERPKQALSTQTSIIEGQLDSRYTFDSFVLGASNELVYAACRRVAENTQISFNPLFIHGGVGLGKTHLLQAMIWHIRTHQPNRRVMYLSSEQFLVQFVRALREKDTMSFKEALRSVDVLVIDDIQFIAGREQTQEELFHTFNALLDQNKQIVLSGDRAPTEMEGLQENLRSRLSWGLVADIRATSFDLRMGIVERKAEQLSIQLPKNVKNFLAQKITSNVRELEGALNRLAAHASLVGRLITIETAQELLADLLRANDRRISIEEIQKRVSDHYNIKLAEMHSARRARIVARPRQIAMYLSKKLTSRSLPEIGRRFGGRDHTTVMHAVRKVEELCGQDINLAEDVELLQRMLES